MKTAQLAALSLTCLLGIMPGATSAQPYVISADGTEVTDQQTGLIWRRCSEGMKWDGTTCAGVAGRYTHEAAFLHTAAQASSTGIAWRLPNIKELASLVSKNRILPTIDVTAFPATSTDLWSWSSTPIVGNSSDAAWVFSFTYGNILSAGRYLSGHVRLVRTGQ